LQDAQQARKAGEPANLLATSYIACASGENEDIGENGVAGCGTEENEKGGDAKGAPARDDPGMLGKIGEEDPNEDQADCLFSPIIAHTMRGITRPLIRKWNHW
jgi:hypothetical protein